MLKRWQNKFKYSTSSRSTLAHVTQSTVSETDKSLDPKMKLLPIFSSSKVRFSPKMISLGSLVNIASVAQLSREATLVFSAVGKCKLPSKRHLLLFKSARYLTSLTQTPVFT